MSKHRKQAENWLRKNCQNALEMSLKCFETMSADERISVLQYGILNDQSQGRNGKRKTIKTMKRIFLNINRSFGIDIINDEEYRPVMVTLYNTYFPPVSDRTFGNIVDANNPNERLELKEKFSLEDLLVEDQKNDYHPTLYI